ncbi:AAA family ATPase [Mycolicibacterium helvum]|uniref:Adenylyl-sulfate kinase n=1 Tax=Mycolicibacterium helvum TaxID=1534349 RepID=A0A7I7T3R9_9MYCO|nr:AAA family ATPase [Mycolicibacterium helvum]BBY62746.1 adenylyl-sulfate kinase [Mycolicibacterium helvum]
MAGRKSTLIVLSGLPGVGKTTLARSLSAAINGVHLRLDTIEAALTTSGIIERVGGWDAFPDVGYRVAWSLARDHLGTGHDVVADSVNPLAMTRRAWAACAQATGSTLIEVEVFCSDINVHRRRVEARVSDLDGLAVPTWRQVEERLYEPWSEPILRVDTVEGIGEAISTIAARLAASEQSAR